MLLLSLKQVKVQSQPTELESELESEPESELESKLENGDQSSGTMTCFRLNNCKCILIQKEKFRFFERVPFMEAPGINPGTVCLNGDSTSY